MKMNKQETVKLLSMLKVAYPKFFVSTTDEEMQMQISLWFNCLKDYSFDMIQQSVYNLIKTLKFPPTIADITESVRKLMYPDELTEQEAVNLIIKSLDNAYYKPNAAFNSLPKILRRVVGDPQQLKQWAIMDNNAVQSVVSSNLQRSYRALLQNKKEKQLTGKYIEDQIAPPKEVKQIEQVDYKPIEKENVTSLISHAVEIVRKSNKNRGGNQC